MTYLDINTIVARHFLTTTDKLMQARISDARSAANLICHEVLNASTIKLASWYNKRQHTTPMRAMRTAKGLIETNTTFRLLYKAASMEVQAAYNAEIEKKHIKQIYNLNYRVRQKGMSVRTSSRTLSINADQLNEIEGTQLKKLLNKHHYVIQLSIIGEKSPIRKWDCGITPYYRQECAWPQKMIL